MDKYQVELYLNRHHTNAVNFMSPVLNLGEPLLSVPVRITKSIGSGYRYTRNGEPEIVIPDWFLNRENISERERIGVMEYDCIHETGHHFHDMLNPRVWIETRRENKRTKRLAGWKRTARFAQLIELNELVAELFTFLYFDLTGGVETFLSGSGRKVSTLDNEFMKVWKFWGNHKIPIFNRLIRSSYEGAKYLPGVGLLFQKAERMIRDNLDSVKWKTK